MALLTTQQLSTPWLAFPSGPGSWAVCQAPKWPSSSVPLMCWSDPFHLPAVDHCPKALGEGLQIEAGIDSSPLSFSLNMKVFPARQGPWSASLGLGMPLPWQGGMGYQVLRMALQEWPMGADERVYERRIGRTSTFCKPLVDRCTASAQSRYIPWRRFLSTYAQM